MEAGQRPGWWKLHNGLAYAMVNQLAKRITLKRNFYYEE
jgi:hypothetical protein